MKAYVFALLIGTALLASVPERAPAQYHPNNVQYLHRYWYYPFYYFPHNYWPVYSAPWPEPIGMPPARPPAYMTYPPFLEPNWRYDFWQPQRYHRGHHFWLDQF
jgi:hypothetical protein